MGIDDVDREDRDFGDRGGRGGRGGGGGDERRGGGGRQGGGGRRKACRFCADVRVVMDYKDTALLQSYVTDRGKLVPRRISGNCAKHQRAITQAVKRARNIALMPFTVQGE